MKTMRPILSLNDAAPSDRMSGQLMGILGQSNSGTGNLAESVDDVPLQVCSRVQRAVNLRYRETTERPAEVPRMLEECAQEWLAGYTAAWRENAIPCGDNSRRVASLR